LALDESVALRQRQARPQASTWSQRRTTSSGTSVLQGVSVDIDRTGAEQLEALSVILADADLAVVVLDLARSASALTPSFLAMQVTIHGADQRITVRSPNSAAGTMIACSSLRIEIAASGGPGRHHRVVFLAQSPDAFIDFEYPHPWVSDTTKALAGHRIERVVVDGDVPTGAMAGPSDTEGNVIGPVDGQRTVERAVGVLMNCGFTVEAARAELEVRAELSQQTATQQAQDLLRSLGGDPPGSISG
jgi:hypothetical protein